MVCTACHGLQGLLRQLMDPMSSARGLGWGWLSARLRLLTLKDWWRTHVQDPQAFKWKRMPLSPIWMTYGLIEPWLWKQLQRNTCCVLSRNSGLRVIMVVMIPYF